ncbi:RlmF-related methyltransferase [Methanocaldococcus infernus]
MLGLKIEDAIKINKNLEKYAIKKDGKVRLNFKDKKALIEYNKTILKHLFNLDMDFHESALVPTPISRYLFLDSVTKELKRIKNKDKFKMLEIGTGSGIIALLAAKIFNYNVVATEVIEDYLKLAEQNILKNSLSENIRLINSRGKIIKGIQELEGEKFDIILSYPPFYDDNAVASGRKFAGALAKEVELIGGGKFGEKFSLRLIEEGLDYLERKGIISIMLPKKPEKRREIIIKNMKELSLEVKVDEINVGKRVRYVIKGIY